MYLSWEKAVVLPQEAQPAYRAAYMTPVLRWLKKKRNEKRRREERKRKKRKKEAIS